MRLKHPDAKSNRKHVPWPCCGCPPPRRARAPLRCWFPTRNFLQVQVSQDFVHLGKSVALFLARLGLPAEALIKIKRKQSAVAATTAAVPLPGAMRTGACGGSTTPSNPESPGCRKRVGEGWGSKVEGSPVLSSVCSPSVRRRPSGAEDGAFAPPTLSQPQHQPTSSTVKESRFSDDTCIGGQRTTRKDETDRFDTIYPVSPLEPLLDGDVLVLSCPLFTMISFQGSVLSECVRGLKILGATTEQLQKIVLSTKAASFLELVLSDCNHFVGRYPAGKDGALLASRYDCRVVAVRYTPTAAAIDGSRNTEEEGSLDGIGRAAFDRSTAERCLLGQGGESVSSPLHGGEKQQCAVLSVAVHGASPGGPQPGGAPTEEYSVEATARPLAPGDVVLVLAKGRFLEMWKDALEFDLVTQVGTVPKAVATYDYLSLVVFCGMLGWVLFSSVAMVSKQSACVWPGFAKNACSCR